MNLIKPRLEGSVLRVNQQTREPFVTRFSSVTPDTLYQNIINQMATVSSSSRSKSGPPFPQFINAIPNSSHRPSTDNTFQRLYSRRVTHDPTHLCARQLDPGKTRFFLIITHGC